MMKIPTKPHDFVPLLENSLKFPQMLKPSLMLKQKPNSLSNAYKVNRYLKNNVNYLKETQNTTCKTQL